MHKNYYTTAGFVVFFLLNVTVRSHYFYDNINATKTAGPPTQHDDILPKHNKVLKYLSGEFIVRRMRWDITKFGLATMLKICTGPRRGWGSTAF
jgi:hypothetical protein